jgi:RNA polymerase sigma factor, sigma-70 family
MDARATPCRTAQRLIVRDRGAEHYDRRSAAQSFERAHHFYVHYGEALERSARRALFAHTQGDAMDLVCEVIADTADGAFPNLPRDDTKALAFLEGVIRHRASHINRREARVVALSGDDVLGDVSDAWQCAARVVVARDVSRALKMLTPREREMATLHWIEGWSSRQIGEALGVSVRTVKELLRRGRRRLRSNLSQYSDDI